MTTTRAAHDDAEFRSSLRRELKAIRRDLPPELDDDADFQNELRLDSLDLVEMVARLEQATGIYVPDEDFPQLKSISATADYVMARRLAASPP
jgi:acyl carrier protein